MLCFSTVFSSVVFLSNPTVESVYLSVYIFHQKVLRYLPWILALCVIFPSYYQIVRGRKVLLAHIFICVFEKKSDQVWTKKLNLNIHITTIPCAGYLMEIIWQFYSQAVQSCSCGKEEIQAGAELCQLPGSSVSNVRMKYAFWVGCIGYVVVVQW